MESAPRTLRRPLALRGRGPRTASPCGIAFAPAPAGWWIRLGRGPVLPFSAARYEALPGRSVLSAGGRRAECVEHAFAALVLLDLDAVLVEIDGPEAPWLDGSAHPYVAAMHHAGLRGRAPASRLDIHVHSGPRSVRWRSGDLRVAAARSPAFADILRDPRSRHRFPGVRPGTISPCDRALRSAGGDRPRLVEEPLHHKLLDLLGDAAPLRAEGPLFGALDLAPASHLEHGPLLRAALAAGHIHRVSESP